MPLDKLSVHVLALLDCRVSIAFTLSTIQWRVLTGDLGKPDRLLWGLNLLPFVMTGLNMAAAFVYEYLYRSGIVRAD